MKRIKNIHTTLFFVLAIFYMSCELTDVTEIEPLYQVDDQSVITNLDQAQSALYGTYGILLDGLDIIVLTPGIASAMGLSMQAGLAGGRTIAPFHNNEVSTDHGYLSSIYRKMYFIINNANHVISKTNDLDVEDVQRKNEIISEARTLRAMMHFYLLRFWGEFFDEDSQYGIVLKDEPITGADVQARASVAATYDSILEDLDFAIENGPVFNNTFYTSKLYAKALKSKVLLYQKSYSEAAQLALEVINSGKTSLEDTFEEIFSKKIFDTKEVIFQSPFDNANDRNNKAFMFRFFFRPSDYYLDFMGDDSRKNISIIHTPTRITANGKFNGSTFNGERLTADTEYFFRLAEVYLIYAEAVLRGDDDLDEALWAVNKIRERSQNSPLNISDKGELIAAIRVEKLLELGAESGEDWFDLVRYHKEGDININDFKTLSSDSRLILPFPQQTVELSEGVVLQNPEY